MAGIELPVMPDDEVIPAETDHPEPLVLPVEVSVRAAADHEIDVRIMPWDTVITHEDGPEMFTRGSFAGTDPSKVLLHGLDHETLIGIDRKGRPITKRRPVGIGTSIEDRGDAAYMTFKIAGTPAGDEVWTLARDGIIKGASIEFAEVPDGSTFGMVNGRRTKVYRAAQLTGLSPTWTPAYERAGVVAVRSENEGDAPVAETPEAPVAGAAPVQPAPQPVDLSPVTSQITEMRSAFDQRFAALEEHQRASFTVPGVEPDADPHALRGDWMGAVLRMLSGERIPDQQLRTLADLVTSDNVGVVPDAYSTELIGVIDPSRPFLNTTRKLDLPAAGMSLVVPTIVTRPTAGVQAIYGDESSPEKADITSTATSITNTTFDAITIAGGGDISIQLLKRSSPSYLSLYLELLAEAYGQNAETQALATLTATVGNVGGVNDGGTLDPENLVLGTAWSAGAAVRKPINTMWMSSTAVGAFIDAKATTTNAPLYSSIQAGFTAGGGTGGTISGLRPVWVPALDTSGYDVIVGPSSGFGWTEDGTYTLQVDVPAKAGRDVALVGMLWFAPMYPTAFTAYGIGS